MQGSITCQSVLQRLEVQLPPCPAFPNLMYDITIALLSGRFSLPFFKLFAIDCGGGYPGQGAPPPAFHGGGGPGFMPLGGLDRSVSCGPGKPGEAQTLNMVVSHSPSDYGGQETLDAVHWYLDSFIGAFTGAGANRTDVTPPEPAPGESALCFFAVEPALEGPRQRQREAK